MTDPMITIRSGALTAAALAIDPIPAGATDDQILDHLRQLTRVAKALESYIKGGDATVQANRLRPQ